MVLESDKKSFGILINEQNSHIKKTFDGGMSITYEYADKYELSFTNTSVTERGNLQNINCHEEKYKCGNKRKKMQETGVMSKK